MPLRRPLLARVLCAAILCATAVRVPAAPAAGDEQAAPPGAPAVRIGPAATETTPAPPAEHAAEPPVPALTPPPADDGPFLGDRYRYANMNVVSRALYDVVAIPANVPRWDAGDWARLGLWTGVVGVLWFGGDPPPDVRIDRWATEHVNPHVPTVWNDVMQPVLWSTIAVGGLGTWWWASATGHDDIAQGFSLMGEALAVAQAYHVGLKLLIGRDGPTDGDGTGDVKGPANALRVYPAGTPSGHAATLFVLASAGFAYFRPPAWVQVLGYAAAGTLVAFHVLDHRHFLSDSVWGAAMGWYVGQWVVRHRASWRFGEGPSTPRVRIAPVAVRGGAGLALTGSF
jgi:hypothetical protein